MRTEAEHGNGNSPPAAAGGRGRHLAHDLLVAAGLVALTLAAYTPVIRHGGFVWDDDILLTDNVLIQRSDGLTIFWWPPADEHLGKAVFDYLPLTWTTLWVEWRLWSDDPTGYHVTNVLLHALAVVLLWRLLRELAIPGAVLAAAIFAAHPVCAASVAWISERKNTLAMVFYLLTLLTYARYDAGRGRRWYVLAILAFLAALLAKAQVIMAPVVLLGLAWWRRGRIHRRDVAAVTPLLALSVVFAAVTLWFHHTRAIGLVSSRPEGFFSRLAAAGAIPWFYLYKAFVPVHLTMVYPRWDVDPAAWTWYVPGAALLATLAVLWVLRETPARAMLATLGYFVIVLFPVLGFFAMSFAKLSLVADHLQYVAILGPIVLVAGAGTTLAGRLRSTIGRAALGVSAAAIIVALAALTFSRGFTFTSRRAMWEDVLAKNPTCPDAHYEMGLFLTNGGNLHRAVEYYKEAIRLRENYSDAHNNLGELYARLGTIRQAGYHFARAVEIRPDNHPARFNLALTQYRIGATRQAAENLHRVIEAIPNYPPALNTLARILATDTDDRLRDGPQAVQLAHRACRLTPPQDPARPRYLDTLAMAYAETGRFDQAVKTALLAAEEARDRGNPALAEEIDQRVALYRAGKPCRDVRAPPTTQPAN